MATEAVSSTTTTKACFKAFLQDWSFDTSVRNVLYFLDRTQRGSDMTELVASLLQTEMSEQE
jgi:hypothetical protein